MQFASISKLIIAIGVLISITTACKKIDLKFKDPAAHCRIVMMTGDIDGQQPLHRQFHYDDFGNPIFVEYVETQGGTGTPNFYFYYNDQHQLIRYIGYGTHDFTYNARGQIIIDSSREYYAGGDARFETKFYYDLYGRMSKEVTKYYYDINDYEGVGETTTWNYRYDHKGNLVRPGVTYDNKKNISRTHPVWMFLNRNYSINNPVRATGYNSSGLPTSFGTENLDFLHSSVYIQTVEYNCDSEAK